MTAGRSSFTKVDDRTEHTPTSVRRRSPRVDFRLRNPSSPDVVFVMKALFSILDPQNRVETNTCFVFAHDFVLALRYLHFFPLLTYITDSQKFLRCLLFTDGRLQLQHSDTSTKSVKRRMLKHQRSSRLIINRDGSIRVSCSRLHAVR